MVGNTPVLLGNSTLALAHTFKVRKLKSTYTSWSTWDFYHRRRRLGTFLSQFLSSGFNYQQLHSPPHITSQESFPLVSLPSSFRIFILCVASPFSPVHPPFPLLLKPPLKERTGAFQFILIPQLTLNSSSFSTVASQVSPEFIDGSDLSIGPPSNFD